MQQSRCKWLDAAKAIAIIFIVLGHVIIDKNSFLRQVIFSFHVPFFFFLAGLTYRTYPKWSVFIKKKVYGLIVPYFIFSAISILIYSFLGRYVSSDGVISTSKSIFGMIYANSRNGLMQWNTPLWFLPVLFVGIVIVDFVERLICRLGGGDVERIAVTLMFWVLGSILEKYPSILLPGQIESAIFCAGFIELGHFIGKERINILYEKLHSPFKIIGIVSVLAGLGVLISWLNGFAEIRILHYGRSSILFIMTSCIFGFAILLISHYLNNMKLLIFVGKYTLIIMALHKFPVLLFQIIPLTRIYLMYDNSFVRLLMELMVSCLCVAMCCVCGIIIEKYFPLAFGKQSNIYKKEKIEL